MSFGFGIGDFIAVSQLAHRLYKDVFLVARDAPKELQTLMCEIALLSQSIDLLIEEVKNPNSILVRAGEVRVDMVNRVMMQANATLKDLEKFANKYEFGEKAGERRKVKRVWDKFKFARELSSLNELRKKVQDHNGTLMLVLTSAGNSSLERMETFNKGMMADIGGIQDMLANAPQAPVVSIIDEKVFQISLSQAFMKSAERTRPWLAIGFDEWIQAGRWWLMKSQSSLYSDLKPNAMVPPQAYADLLKASWILIDIISKHPQMKFWSPTSEYLQVQLLAETLKEELRTIERLGLKKPGLQQIEQADLSIWVEAPAAVALRPATHDLTAQGPGSWHISGEEVYFQRFGIYRPNEKLQDVECMILVLVDNNLSTARIVMQTQKGVDFLSLRVDIGMLDQKDHQKIWEDRKSVDHLHGIRIKDGYLFFNTVDVWIYFKFVITTIVFYLSTTQHSKDHNTIHGLILLSAVRSGHENLIRHIQQEGKRFAQSEDSTNNGRDCSFDGVSLLATEVASIVLENGGDNAAVDSCDYGESGGSLAVCQNWLLGLFKAPSTLIHSNWISAFSQTPFIVVKDDQKVSILNTTFNLAANRGDITVVRALLEGDIDVNTTYPSGVPGHFCYESPSHSTALHLARHEALTQLLLDKGASTEMKDKTERTALHQCLKYDKIVRLLLQKGANIEAKDRNKATPLFLAAYFGYEATVRQLLASGADMEAQDSNGWSPLVAAVSGEHATVVQLLLEKGANIETTTHDFETPLHYAAMRGHKDILQLLLDKGADIEETDEYGRTVLHHVAENGTAAIIPLLLQNGADIFAKNRNQWTAFDLANRHGHDAVATVLLREMTNIQTKDRTEWTALHLAASGQCKTTYTKPFHIVNMLLEMGDNIEAKTDTGDTALHLGAANEDEAVVELLLDEGANIDAKNSSNQTALHIAARQGSSVVVKLLLTKGADTGVSNLDGLTALGLAKDSGHEEIVDLLRNTQTLS